MYEPKYETLSFTDHVAAVFALLLTLVLVPFIALFLIIAKPLRSMIIAYSYVLTGTKVTRPYKWGEI